MARLPDGAGSFCGAPAEVISIADHVVWKPSLEIVKQRSTTDDVARWRNLHQPALVQRIGRSSGPVAVPGLLAFPQGSRRMVGEGVDHETDVRSDFLEAFVSALPIWAAHALSTVRSIAGSARNGERDIAPGGQ